MREGAGQPDNYSRPSWGSELNYETILTSVGRPKPHIATFGGAGLFFFPMYGIE